MEESRPIRAGRLRPIGLCPCFQELLLGHYSFLFLAEPAGGSEIESEMNSAALDRNRMIDQKKVGTLVLNAAVAACVAIPLEKRESIPGEAEKRPDGLNVDGVKFLHSCYPRTNRGAAQDAATRKEIHDRTNPRFKPYPRGEDIYAGTRESLRKLT